MNAKAVATEIGIASALKMSCSIMLKGLEAFVIASYSMVRRYCVEDYFQPTLAETYPQIDWAAQGAYFFSCVVQHCKRRAKEMRESARTVDEAGLRPSWQPRLPRSMAGSRTCHGKTCSTTFRMGAPWQDYADRLIQDFAPK